MILRVRQLRTRVRALSRILSSYQYADPPPPSPDETAPIFLPTLHKAAWWVRAAALALGGEADYDSSPDRPGSNELWFSIPAENISDEEAEAGAGAATEQGDTRSGPPDSGDGAADPLRGGASPGLERDARRKLPQIGGGEGGGGGGGRGGSGSGVVGSLVGGTSPSALSSSSVGVAPTPSLLSAKAKRKPTLTPLDLGHEVTTVLSLLFFLRAVWWQNRKSILIFVQPFFRETQGRPVR